MTNQSKVVQRQGGVRTVNEIAISADGVPIHYEVHGHGAPALVFVHGWCCNRNHWRRQVEHFAPQFTVVAIDLAGHGELGLHREAWTIPAFGQDVVAVIKQLDLAQVVLLGHSMGGAVIVEAALQTPTQVIGLVGIDTFRAIAQTRTKAVIDAFLGPLRLNFREAANAFVSSQMFVPTSEPAFVAAIAKEMAAAPPQMAIGAAEALIGHDAQVRAGLQAIRAPICAINAAYHPTDQEAARRYGVRVALMEGVGHFLMMEDYATFNQLLNEAIQHFLAAV